MRIPRGQLLRVAALEARRPARDDGHKELLGFMTDAELVEYRAILVEHASPCPSCGNDPRQQPRRYCHHHQVVVSWSMLRPEERERVQEIDRAAAARRLDARRQGA